ncbi:MAG: hypothetical protein MJ191_00220 [Clostridium sp.]|nr:hypothetical protein [Clostridium sp.]
MNTYKKLNNKKFKAEKAFWFTTDEGTWKHGPTHYVITDLGDYIYNPNKYSDTEDLINSLIEQGHKPCSYAHMFRGVEYHNKRFEAMLEHALEDLYFYGYDKEPGFEEYKEQLISDYNNHLLYTTRYMKKIKISEII